jgi:exonuclease III
VTVPWQDAGMRPFRVVLALALAAGTLAALPPAPALGGGSGPIELTVGTFNIEYGGTVVDFDAVVEATQATDADVLGIEEAWGHVPRLARAAGYPYFSVRTGIVSRYPIWDPPGARGRYVFVEPVPGRVVAVQNVHLPSAPYGPNRALRGATREELIQLERDVRLPAIRLFLAAAKGLIADGIPVFLVGDFNTPSHRDWTPSTVGDRPQVLFTMPWPVTRAVERAGFRDSFRALHPNAHAEPGLTWWAARPKVAGEWNPGANAPQDRIDLVFASEGTVVDTTVVGERGHPDVDVTVEPWGSDHRAVISTFELLPAPAPVTLSVDERLTTEGTDLVVRAHGGDRVAVALAGDDPVTDAVAEQTMTGPDAVLTFDTSGWAPGAYRATLLDASDATLASTRLWIAAQGAGPEVTTSKPAYALGESIEVSWTNVRGDRWDWLGIYRRSADPKVAWYLLWTYTDARVAGTTTLDRTSAGPWPLSEGRYRVYVLRDDGYAALAGADFDVG